MLFERVSLRLQNAALSARWYVHNSANDGVDVVISKRHDVTLEGRS